MDPISIGLLAGGALGLVGQQQAGQQASRSAAEQNRILQSVPLPILKEYYPDLYKQVVALNPELEQAVNLEESKMADLSTNPAFNQAQMNALLKLQEVGDQGGMTATDRSRLAQIQGENETALRGQQGAIMQNLATRGMGGGMSELVARQLATQEGANRQAQQGLDVKAQAEQRALQAIMQSGQLGGQMQQQQFGQQAQVAQARDAINRFNAANTQDVQARNIGSKNQAQEWNAAQAQNVAGQNVNLSNQAQQYNLNIPQQQYANQLSRATGQAEGLARQQQIAAQNQQATNQMIGGLIQTGAGYASTRNKQKIPGEV